MNIPISPSPVPKAPITAPTTAPAPSTITPAPPAEKKPEPLTCEQRDEAISRLRSRPNDGGVNSWGRLAGNLLFILDTPRNCPTP